MGGEAGSENGKLPVTCRCGTRHREGSRPGLLRITKYLFFHQNSKVSLKRCVIVAKGTEGLREVMYKVITRMIADGELVPVYEDDELVDIIVKAPVDTNT